MNINREMISGTEPLLGKRIVGVLAKEREGSPSTQVFLVFDDDTVYEFYGPQIYGSKGLWPGDVQWARDYMGGEILFEHSIRAQPNAELPFGDE